MKKIILLFGAVFSCFLMVSMPLLPAVQFTSMENAMKTSAFEEIQVITHGLEGKQELSSLFFKKKIMQLQTGLQNDTAASQGLEYINKGLLQDGNISVFLLIFLGALVLIIELINIFIGLALPLLPLFAMLYIDTPHVDEDGPLTGGFDDVYDLTNFFDSVYRLSFGIVFLIWALIFRLYPEIFEEISIDTEEGTVEFPAFFTIIQTILEMMSSPVYYGNPISILFTLFLFKKQVSKPYNMMLDAFDVIDYDEDGY